jgi:hypothetical protein
MGKIQSRHVSNKVCKLWIKYKEQMRSNVGRFFCLSLPGQSSLSDDCVVWANGIFYNEQVHRQGYWY